jgi:hypothetical protein
MSASTAIAAPDGTAAPPPAEAVRVQRQMLRIGGAVAVGMTVAVAAGSLLPFLAPLFAGQFLAASRRPLGVVQAIVTALAILMTGWALQLLAATTGGSPTVFIPLLWLFYFACFRAQTRGKGGPLPGLMLAIGVIVPLTEMLHSGLDRSMIAALSGAVLGGALLSWAAHAVFPDPGGAASPQAAAPAEAGLWRPAASATILTGAVVLCLVDSRLSSAIVVPVTVATVLGQLDLARSRRVALGLVVVNLIGGVAASFAFAVIELRPVLPVLFLVVLFAGLLFGRGAATDPEAGKIHAGALTIFLILLGLGVSPLPGSTPESFATRITYVTAAVLGTLWACLLLWPRPTRPEIPE